ncbi:MAG TPA: hypothetical protein DFR83_06640 [Deltaproteobacteria bacterium]|nr:hypothetical protein [Deltaproteobacteria bacterium]
MVLSAIERTARQRAGKRRRTRLTLRACKGEVKKLFTTRAAPPAAASTGARSPQPDTLCIFEREAERIEQLEVPAEAASACAELVHALRQIARHPDPALDASTRAAGAIRSFHEALWASTSGLQIKLQQEALLALAPLEAVVSAKIFADLVDEHVRQAIRKIVPGIEIGPLWAQLNPGAAA